MRALIAWSVIALTALSLAWTTWKARRILRQSLGRNLRRGEETSLRSWMELSTGSLDTANRELARNPFERVLRALQKLRLWNDRFVRR